MGVTAPGLFLPMKPLKPRTLGKRKASKKEDKQKANRTRGDRWMRIRKLILLEEPLCRHCLTEGRTTQAREVDHIIPLEDEGTDDRANLQALCRQCHKQKTAFDTAKRAVRKLKPDT